MRKVPPLVIYRPLLRSECNRPAHTQRDQAPIGLHLVTLSVAQILASPKKNPIGAASARSFPALTRRRLIG
ncbi:hypothetical protein SS05631_c39840 [Sinorhizobium sp. CCBAU 05631]|nr:hypothetical protein SS05631_c39840 [Sinorhizobium sp. CCBAU 05631]